MENLDMNLENILEDEIQEAEMERIQMYTKSKFQKFQNITGWIQLRLEIEDAINQIKGEQPEPINEQPEEFDIEIIVDFRPKSTGPGM